MLLILSGDKPIFQHNFNRQEKLQIYFVIHSALDAIDTVLEHRKQFYIGQLRTEQIPIFCHVNPIGLRIILAFPNSPKEFDKKSELAIKDFLSEINRNLSIVLLNPLYGGGKLNKSKNKTGPNIHSQQIKSSYFEDRVSNLGKQFLRSIIQTQKKK